MSPIILIGGLVAWSGYTVIWVGGLMLRGFSGPGRPQGPGVLDLILPSRAAKVANILAAGAPTTTSPAGVAPGAGPQSTTTAPGGGPIGPAGQTANQTPGNLGGQGVSGPPGVTG